MSRTAKNAVIIMVATLLSRVLGFLRETILANFYGTSMVADVFVLTFNIPGLIISIVGSVIYMMYIPMYYDTRDRLGENEALKFTNNILNIFIKRLFIQIIINFRTHSTAWLPWELITRNR